jgi:hypothetical protein
MSAFDSAMLMIEDLSTQVTELSKHIWELQLAIWHSHLDPRDGMPYAAGQIVRFAKRI